MFHKMWLQKAPLSFVFAFVVYKITKAWTFTDVTDGTPRKALSGWLPAKWTKGTFNYIRRRHFL
jgi:hypothetical protein